MVEKVRNLLVEIKDYNVMTDGWNFFDELVKNNLRTYDNIWNTATSQRDDYPINCLLDHHYFRNYYKMTARRLSKQQAFDADLKSIQQINFIVNLNQAQNKMFFIIEEAKKKQFRFFTRNCKSFVILLCFDIASI